MTLIALGPLAKDDALTLIAGKLIGSGMSREVYEYRINPTNTVLKVESTVCFQNIREWVVWQAVKESKSLNRWFAPCISISDYGGWMLQERTAPVTLKYLQRHLPRVPAFFTDLKTGNWGRVGNRIVCHDYGTAMTAEIGLSVKKMRRAEWWQ